MMERFGKINLIHDDCMNYIRSLPDNAYDLAIVDPPYGIGIGKCKIIGKRSEAKHRRYTFYQSGDWDAQVPNKEYFDHLFRVSKSQIIWGANYFSGIVDFSLFSWIVWKKPYIMDTLSFGMGELAVYSGKKPLRIFDCNHDGNRVSSGNHALARANAKIHQCQKPVRLYKWLLKQYANAGDKILDTHLGSGSICLACHDGGFEMTGIEIDADYYAGARERLKRHQMQNRIDF